MHPWCSKCGHTSCRHIMAFLSNCIELGGNNKHLRYPQWTVGEAARVMAAPSLLMPQGSPCRKRGCGDGQGPQPKAARGGAPQAAAPSLGQASSGHKAPPPKQQTPRGQGRQATPRGDNKRGRGNTPPGGRHSVGVDQPAWAFGRHSGRPMKCFGGNFYFDVCMPNLVGCRATLDELLVQQKFRRLLDSEK